MSSLLLNKYSPLVEEIKTEFGDKSSHIWLLVNPKYPSVRNDIWVPILEVIQDKVYRTLKNRIDTRNIYIKNTISDIGLVSNGSLLGSAEIADDIWTLRESIFEYRPKMIFTFGNLTYELVNRICEIRPEEGPKYWSSSNLEYEFVQSLANFDISKTNTIPLPRQIMAKSTSTEKYDSYWEERENYCRDVGTMIADRVIENKDHLNIWID